MPSTSEDRYQEPIPMPASRPGWPKIWGFDLGELNFSAFKSSNMFDRRWHLRRERFGEHARTFEKAGPADFRES